MKEHQERVREFMDQNDLGGTTPFRLLDLVSEIGEVVADATKSSDYDESVEEMDIEHDEFGDVLFSLMAVANDLEVDLDEAFEEAMQKYSRRMNEKGDPGSG